MYVCLCNAVTDCQIREAYCEGACSMRLLRQKLGVAGCCGRCAPCARDVLIQCRQQGEREQAPALEVEPELEMPVPAMLPVTATG